MAPRRWAPAPIRPRTGVATAPARRVTVNVHCALASDTWKVVATLVMSGAPRLPTAATTRAMKSNDGARDRGSRAGEATLTGSCRW